MSTLLEASGLPPETDVTGYSFDRVSPPFGMTRRALRSLALQDRLIRFCDIVISIGLILFFLPLFLVVAAMIAPSGSILFAHPRIGRGGREFRCLKFRSMVTDAEAQLRILLESDPIARAQWQCSQKLKNDPRITPLGHLLRKTSLDELPQLFNVLAGSMSIVGPRPIVRDEVARYGRYFKSYRAVRPGLTGLWQVSGRSDTTYRRRVALDVLYVRRRSALLYVTVLARTPLMVVRTKGSY